MENRRLNKPPLIEAIFEIRWELVSGQFGGQIDPHYKLLVGSVFENVKEQYPYPEELPAANIPIEMSAYIVQHRFRKSKDDWPLIQIGPGIMTLNHTDSYNWSDFQEGISRFLDILWKIYPRSNGPLKPSGLLLRYINGVNLDYSTTDAIKYIHEMLKLHAGFQQELFQDTGVESKPLNFDLRFTFPSSLPKGAIHIRFVRGTKNGQDAFIWENQIQSIGQDVAESEEEIKTWVNAAHNLMESWFFKMIKGPLERSFE